MCGPRCAALGAFGLISNQNINIRWVYPSFDSTTLLGACGNMDDVLGVLRNVRRTHTLVPHFKSEGSDVSRALSPCGSLCPFWVVSLVKPSDGTWFWLSRSRRVSPFPFFSGRFWVTMDVSDTPSTLTFSDHDQLVEHNVWKRCLVQWRLSSVCAEPKRVTSMSDVARARGLDVRRREGRLRAFWRHEQFSIKMATVTMSHTSS